MVAKQGSMLLPTTPCWKNRYQVILSYRTKEIEAYMQWLYLTTRMRMSNLQGEKGNIVAQYNQIWISTINTDARPTCIDPFKTETGMGLQNFSISLTINNRDYTDRSMDEN